LTLAAKVLLKTMDTTIPSAEKVGGRMGGREGVIPCYRDSDGAFAFITPSPSPSSFHSPSSPSFSWTNQVEFFTLTAGEKEGRVVHTTLAADKTTSLLEEVSASTSPEGDM
jgi:hypothetical protein